MKIKINNKEYEAQAGEMILEVAKRNGIKIPTLCHFEGCKKEVVCRVCLVEINLSDKLVPSCAFPVCENLEVETESERAVRARKTNLEILWSDHAGKCNTCKKNQACEFQALAQEYKIDNFHFIPRKGEITGDEELDLLKDNKSRVVVEDKNPCISRTTEFCVECRRCINACPTQEFGFNHRAGDTVVGTPFEKELDCIFCGQCVKVCPTAALTDKNDLKKIAFELDNVNKLAVAIVDGEILENQKNIVKTLRELGFEKVFDLSWGNQKFLEELNEELQENPKKIISSFCPSLNLYIEKYEQDLKKYLCETDNPDNLMAKAVKTKYAQVEKINPENMVVISISPCVAKKAVKNKFLDYILTMRELARLKLIKSLKEEDGSVEKKKGEPVRSGNNFDKFLDAVETQRIGKIGGIFKNIKARKNPTSVSGIVEIKNIFKSIKRGEPVRPGNKFDLIEGFVCENGCVNGGGKLVNKN